MDRQQRALAFHARYGGAHRRLGIAGRRGTRSGPALDDSCPVCGFRQSHRVGLCRTPATVHDVGDGGFARDVAALSRRTKPLWVFSTAAVCLLGQPARRLSGRLVVASCRWRNGKCRTTPVAPAEPYGQRKGNRHSCHCACRRQFDAGSGIEPMGFSSGWMDV